MSHSPNTLSLLFWSSLEGKARFHPVVLSEVGGSAAPSSTAPILANPRSAYIGLVLVLAKPAAQTHRVWKQAIQQKIRDRTKTHALHLPDSISPRPRFDLNLDSTSASTLFIPRPSDHRFVRHRIEQSVGTIQVAPTCVDSCSLRLVRIRLPVLQESQAEPPPTKNTKNLWPIAESSYKPQLILQNLVSDSSYCKTLSGFPMSYFLLFHQSASRNR